MIDPLRPCVVSFQVRVLTTTCCFVDRGRPQGREGAAQGVGAGRGARVRLSPRRLLKAVSFQAAAAADRQRTDHFHSS
jgi:hypothetical protein